MTPEGRPTAAPAAALFDPDAAAPAKRLAVAQLISECFAFVYPEDPPLIPEQEMLSLGFVTPDEKVEQFAVWEGGRALAWGRLEYSLEQNRHLGHLRLLVHPQARRRGLGRAVFAELERSARRAGQTTLICVTTTRAPAGEPFAKMLGASPALINRTSQLMLDQVSGELLSTWLTRPDSEPYTLHLWSTLPGEYLARLADLTMVMNTAPRGELEFDDWTTTPEMLRAWEEQLSAQGEVCWTAAVEDTRSGELVGYSQMYWSPLRAAALHQGATAVRPSARGLGLGKWLKAALTRQVASACPGARWIRTGNANENAAMLGINAALGFLPWAETTEWQLKLEFSQA